MDRICDCWVRRTLIKSYRLPHSKVGEEAQIKQRRTQRRTWRKKPKTFHKQAIAFVRALEARGPPFLRSSRAQISVSQIDDPLTRYALCDFSELMPCLAGEEALSLAEARLFYNSCLLDSLCSVLGRLQWRQFCDQLDTIAGPDSGLILIGCGLDCLQKQISAHVRVRPQSDAATARLETFGRYFL